MSFRTKSRRNIVLAKYQSFKITSHPLFLWLFRATETLQTNFVLARFHLKRHNAHSFFGLNGCGIVSNEIRLKRRSFGGRFGGRTSCFNVGGIWMCANRIPLFRHFKLLFTPERRMKKNRAFTCCTTLKLYLFSNALLSKKLLWLYVYPSPTHIHSHPN